MELRDTRVLVTGASSGIGRALAVRLAGQGARLVVSARRQELLETLAAEVAAAGGVRPVAVQADLAIRGEASRLAGAAIDALGAIDVLVNNAGGGVGGHIGTVGEGDVGREAYEVNFWSPLALVAALLPGMRNTGGGLIVNVTSSAPGIPWPGFGMYASTKAALSTVTETLRNELAGTGVHVLEVVPGPVDTAIQGETRLAPGIERVVGRLPLGDADELAKLTVQAMRRGKGRLVYPRWSRMGTSMPLITRRFTAREAARVFTRMDPATRKGYEGLVVRTGSHGDDVVRLARERWETARGR